MKTKNITLIAMLSAISAILMIFEFQLPFSPSFIKFDFSDLPVMLGGFLLGPIAGSIIGILKILLNILLNGTSTMFIGELSNLFLTLTFVLSASIVYLVNKTKQNAIKGLIISVILTSILAIISNIYFIFPLYARVLNMTMSDIVNMVIVVNPLVKDVTTMVIYSLLPFNIVKYSIIAFLTMISYKKLSYLFKR